MLDESKSAMAPHTPRPAGASIEWRNKECLCLSLDRGALHQALATELGTPELVQMVEQRCPYVFAAQPVYVSESQIKRMAKVVQAIASVVALPAYRARILADAPAIAKHDPGGASGVFFGFDFHLGTHGVSLIEVNTNAGGAMLNAVLARAQRACCADVEALLPTLAEVEALETGIVDMFHLEWGRSGRNKPLHTIAIVDEMPEEQYLYPEFLLFQRLFERHGLRAVIADPGALTLRGGVLWHGDTPIDLVYNRLTDFYLASPASAALRAAYLARAVVLTPHPQAHALYADKRNLALLSDESHLYALGVAASTCAVLTSGIPHTEVVDAADAERLWKQRRTLFFKPRTGFGSRAAYRGDKLTRRVWQEILAGDYVAQAMIAPPERTIQLENAPQILKYDLRAYVYDGGMQWIAARLYQGQTTNFRTPGGGFSPVYHGATCNV